VGESDDGGRSAGRLDHRLEIVGAGLHVVRAGPGGPAGAAVVEADDPVIRKELGLERVIHGRVRIGVRRQYDEWTGATLLPVDLHAIRTLYIRHGSDSRRGTPRRTMVGKRCPWHRFPTIAGSGARSGRNQLAGERGEVLDAVLLGRCGRGLE